MNDQADAPAHPLNAIAEQFKPSDIERHPPGEQEVAPSPPSLSLLKLSSPAILIDQTLRVVWQNSEACEELWHITDHQPNPPQTPSIFELLLSADFQHRVATWKQWLTFFLERVRHLATASDLESAISELADEKQQLVRRMLTDLEDRSQPAIAISGLHGSLHDGHGTAFDIAVTRFESNLLMAFEPRPADVVQRGKTEAIGTEKHSQMPHPAPEPTRTEVCVLSAVLDGAQTIRTEMLDEEYGLLFLRIWQICTETIEAFGGQIGQVVGTGFLSYFLPGERTPSPSLGAVQCALELKRNIMDVGREWKIRKGWLHDIDLNIGIHTGVEQMAILPSSSGDHLLPLGATMDVATYLSGVSSGGQIWATKALIHRVPENELKSLRFGIFRTDSHRQVFIARYFSRIRDLAAVRDSDSRPKNALGACPVTQLFDRQGHG